MTLHHPGPETPWTLHLVYSFACNLSCGHCIFRCGPDVRRTMGLGRAKASMDQAARAGIRRIVFTGGEPLLHPRDLRVLLLYAADKDMKSALMTNAAWASSMSRTEECLADLKTAGLQSITLSTDRYHLLSVPVENLQRALAVAEEVGLRATVKISRLAHDPVAEGLYRSLRGRASKIIVQEISPLGRAASLRHAVDRKPAWRFAGSGCATPPVLLPDGSLLACCNLPARDMQTTDDPFILGSIENDSLRSLLDKRARDPLLAALRSNGPGSLYALVARRAPLSRCPTRLRYHSGCDLCFHLFCRLKDKRLLYETIETPTHGEDPSLGAAL